jgi:hypothetical protein
VVVDPEAQFSESEPRADIRALVLEVFVMIAPTEATRSFIFLR